MQPEVAPGTKGQPRIREGLHLRMKEPRSSSENSSSSEDSALPSWFSFVSQTVLGDSPAFLVCWSE